MPFYDYVCQDCGHTMEVMHSVHGHGPSACPNCGGHMKKAVTAPAVHFKGSGWARKERTSKASKPAEETKPAAAGAGESASSPSGSDKPSSADD